MHTRPPLVGAIIQIDLTVLSPEPGQPHRLLIPRLGGNIRLPKRTRILSQLQHSGLHARPFFRQVELIEASLPLPDPQGKPQSRQEKAC